MPVRAVVLPRQDLMPLDAGPLRGKWPVMAAEEDTAGGTLDALVLPPQPFRQVQPVMLPGVFPLFRFIRLMPERYLHHGTRDLK